MRSIANFDAATITAQRIIRDKLSSAKAYPSYKTQLRHGIHGGSENMGWPVVTLLLNALPRVIIIYSTITMP